MPANADSCIVKYSMPAYLFADKGNHTHHRELEFASSGEDEMTPALFRIGAGGAPPTGPAQSRVGRPGFT